MHRVYDIEAGQMMISSDLNFDESAFGLSMLMSNEAVDGLDLELIGLDDEDPRHRYFQQTAKRKAQPSHKNEDASIRRVVHLRLDLEEASASDDRYSRRAYEDEGRNAKDQHETPTLSALWNAGVNAVASTANFSEPSTFEPAVSGPD